MGTDCARIALLTVLPFDQHHAACTRMHTRFPSLAKRSYRLSASGACLGNREICFAFLVKTERPYFLRDKQPFAAVTCIEPYLTVPEACEVPHETCEPGVRSGSHLRHWCF